MRGSCRNKKATLRYARKVVSKLVHQFPHRQQSVQKTTMMYLSAWNRNPTQSNHSKKREMWVKRVFFTFGWRRSEPHSSISKEASDKRYWVRILPPQLTLFPQPPKTCPTCRAKRERPPWKPNHQVGKPSMGSRPSPGECHTTVM